MYFLNNCGFLAVFKFLRYTGSFLVACPEYVIDKQYYLSVWRCNSYLSSVCVLFLFGCS